MHAGTAEAVDVVFFQVCSAFIFKRRGVTVTILLDDIELQAG